MSVFSLNVVVSSLLDYPWELPMEDTEAHFSIGNVGPFLDHMPLHLSVKADFLIIL